jgi:cytochrome P450
LTDEATILVIAASESPAKTLALIHFYLMNNPLKLRKLRQELKDSMSNSHKIPSLSKLESLPYMSAVVKEGLRLHGGITARSSRVAPNEALQYKEWTIPPGTPVSTSSVFIHRNPEIFPDPLDFKPERWLEKSTAARRLDHYLVAFGKGTRNCIGLNLGSAEIYITLAHVIINFEMELFETDISDIKMVRDWYVPQPKLNSIGIQARILNRAA